MRSVLLGGWSRLCCREDTAESPLCLSLMMERSSLHLPCWGPWFPRSFALAGRTLRFVPGARMADARVLCSCLAGWLPARPFEASLSGCSQISTGADAACPRGPPPTSPRAPACGHAPLGRQPLWASAEHKSAAGLGQGVRVTAISPVVVPHHLSFRLCHFLIFGDFIHE